MMYPELEPLLQKVAALQGDAETSDIYHDILQRAERARTVSVAQEVCAHVIKLCHPKAWGDRYLSQWSFEAWMLFLEELTEVANGCGQALFRRSSDV